MYGGTIIPIVPKMLVDGGYLAGGLTYDTIIQPAVDVIPYSQIFVMLRLHSKSADSATEVNVILRDTDPSSEDGQDFTMSSVTFLSVTATDGTAVPSLIKSAVVSNPGPFLRVIVRVKGPSAAGKAAFEISADMIGRSGV